MAESVLLIIGLLAVGFIATRLSALLRVPHSVFLVLAGIAGGIILRWHDASHPYINLEAFPEIVLFVLLPPLIFESAYHINFQDLRRDIVPIGTLAVIALLISTAFIGLGLTLLLKIPLFYSLLFGALISATDPVAVVALFRQIGAPRRLCTIVEGESLINDGTAIVLFRLLLGFVVSTSIPGNVVFSGIIQFFSVVLGGIIVGLVFIVIVSLLLRLTTDSAGAQLGFTVAAAYGSFIVADHWFHASGVIATMTVGLYLGNRARIELNREALNGMQGIWEFLALCANILVFLAVGLSVNFQTLNQDIAYIPLTLLLVYLARTVSVLFTLQPLKWLKLGNPVRLSYQAVLIWGGLRGGLALALVLILPHSLPYRHQFITMTTAVVLAYLIINALTTAPLMRLLRLTILNESEKIFYSRSVVKILNEAYDTLSQVASYGSLSPHLISQLKDRSLSNLDREEQSPPESPASLSFDIQSLLYTEQEYYNRQLEEEIISRLAYVTLTDLVSHRVERYREEGLEGLQAFTFDINPGESWLQKRLMTEARLPSLAVKLEILLHLDFGLNLTEGTLSEGSTARDLTALWKKDARKKLDEFYKTYPHMGMAVQSEFVARRVDMSARHALNDMRESGIISNTVHIKASAHIREIYQNLMKESSRMMNPTLRDLLAQIPLFMNLPENALSKIEEKALHHRYAAGTVVVEEGSSAESIYIVLSGILEAYSHSTLYQESRTRMLAGSFFGEISLLLGRARSATVVALVDSELAEIGRDLFSELTAEYPQIAQEVQHIARKRMQKDLFIKKDEKEGDLLDTAAIFEMLAEIPLFSEFSPGALIEIQRRACRRTVQAGETVVNKSDKCVSLCMVLSGVLEREENPFASYSEHMRLQRGDYFGEDSLLLGSEILTTIRACSNAEIMEISASTFERLLREFPKDQARFKVIREKRLNTLE